MVVTIKPDKFIKIGYKDGRLVSVDWTDLVGDLNAGEKSQTENIVHFLEQCKELYFWALF